MLALMVGFCPAVAHRWLPIALILGLGCGDDGVSASDTEGNDSSSSATAPSTSSSPPTTSTSSSGPDTDTTGDPTTTDGTSTTTGGPDLEVDIDVTLHDSQPMVVDVHLTTSIPVTDVSLAHTFDAGVVIEGGGDDTDFDFRIRGLAPATLHEIEYTIDGTVDTFDFTTNAPLPGFIGAFPVDPGDNAEGADYRMFDLIPFPAFDTASVFQVDAEGTTRWHLGYPSNSMAGPEGVLAAAKVRDDGSMMYLQLHEFFVRDELGDIILSYTDNDLGVTGLHHDVTELPNGNFLAMTFTFDIVYYDLTPVLTAGDGIVEFTPEGEQVWFWDSFDHLDPQRITEPIATTFYLHPETGDVAYDWTHGNAVVYDEETDLILVSLRHQDWILAIDHETGDIEYTLGYEGDFTLDQGEWFFHQHSPQWQPDGSLLLYDNGIANPFIAPEDYESHAVRFELDFDNMIASRVWIDDAPPTQAAFAGDADLLPESGNYLVSDSSIFGPKGLYSIIREIDPEGAPMLQWQLTSPDATFIYRATAQPNIFGQVP